MARSARIVLPDTPHHITQRGNRGEPVFFQKSDYQDYKTILAEECAENGVAIWSYCLLPNAVHLIAVPRQEDSLSKALGSAHRRYTRLINDRMGWTGHLWQDRFFSCPMDEEYLLLSARFIEMVPVAAGIAPEPEKYLWSSARAHICQRDDPLLDSNKPLLSFAPDWAAFIQGWTSPHQQRKMEAHLHAGRPLGSDSFLDDVAQTIGRNVRPKKRGRKKSA